MTERQNSYLSPHGRGYISDRSIDACSIILKYGQAPELKEKIIQWLLERAREKYSVEKIIFPCMCLKLLLKQQDEKVKSQALRLCENIIAQADGKDPAYKVGLISILFPQLKKMETGQKLCQKIQELLMAEFNEIMSHHNKEPSDEDCSDEGSFDVIEVFLSAPQESLRQQAYEYLKYILIEGDNDKAEWAAETITENFPEDHPWAQEAINLMVGRENISHPHSPFALHKLLLEKTKESVNHHPQSTQLADGRIVSFNLDTLKTRRHFQNVPLIKHAEFVALATQLVKEVEDSPQANADYKSIAGTLPPDVLLKKAENSFFERLLDDTKAIKPPEKVSLLSLKLRYVIATAKARQSQNLEMKKKVSSSEGLSSHSKLICQLLINVLKCDTNKEDGIDHSYRLLSEGPIVSEEKMQGERLVEKAKEFFLEDLRQMREGLLDGEGPVVTHLLFSQEDPKNKKVDEPPHQGKYLLNLLGDQIGTFIEGGKVSFDTNGGAVNPELRKCTKQQALDVLYLYHTPEKVINHYLEKFNKREFNLGLKSKDQASVLISHLLPGKLKDIKYAVFVDDDPEDDFITWKSLVVAEVLLRLGILKEVKSLH